MKKIILLLVVGLCFITGCEQKKEEEQNELKINHFASEDTKIESFITKDNQLVIYLENNSSSMVDFYDIDVAIYDKDNELLKTGEPFLKNILVNSSGYASIDLPKDEKENVIDISKIDVKVHENRYDLKTSDNYKDKIKVSYTKNEEDKSKVNVKITNSSNQKLNELEIKCLLKENDKIVAVLSINLNEMDKEEITTIYIPTLMNNDTIEYISYDEIEFHVNHAIKNKQV